MGLYKHMSLISKFDSMSSIRSSLRQRNYRIVFEIASTILPFPSSHGDLKANQQTFFIFFMIVFLYRKNRGSDDVYLHQIHLQ